MPKNSTLWKRITCIMMIRAGRDNRDIMQCVQCSLNTVKAIRSKLGENSEDDEAVAARKPHSQRRDCVRTDAFLADLQVFSCVLSEGDVMPPHFFEQGLRLNADGYISMLDTVVKPWITRVANGRPYVFQRDSAPCHTGSKTIKWLVANFKDFTTPNVWPPSSPELNTMDYFVWGVVERDTNRTSSNTKAELMAKIRSVFAALTRETVARACSRFRRRVEAVIEAEGGYIE
ncbi:uncharacterized protein LOC133393851 [Anopheles gambiae]|uniref:uncharacterized protein LOC133393851 n=1 Tax=Anopheles gambiae TaxID=7165 RepID=UPI002AC8C6F8|nr:uncharacterized protein LOC133393851 [Anopheles gambiae]